MSDTQPTQFLYDVYTVIGGQKMYIGSHESTEDREAFRNRMIEAGVYDDRIIVEIAE